MQEDVALEKGLRVLHPGQQAAGRETETLSWLEPLQHQSPPTVTPLLPQGHTSLNASPLCLQDYFHSSYRSGAVAGHLPSMCKHLSPAPSTAKI